MKSECERLVGKCSLAEAALRFCLSAPRVSCVIPGMRRVGTVESSYRATAASGMLDKALLQKLKRHTWDRNFYE